MQNNNQAINSEFFSRLAKLPVVHSALDQATFAYNHVKQRNTLLNYALSKIEESVIYASGKVHPVVRKFEKHISTADSLACKGLDRLEQKVPLVRKPAGEIFQDTQELYTNLIQSSKDRYNSLSAYGTEKVSVLSRYGTQKVDLLLASEYGKVLRQSLVDVIKLTTGIYIDLYYFSNFMFRVTLDPAVIKFRSLKEAIETRIYERLTELTTTSSNAKSFWSQLNEVPDVPEDSTNLSLGQKGWYVAQVFTVMMVDTYNLTVTSVQAIPPVLLSKVMSAYDYPFKTYSAAKKLSQEVTELFLQQTAEKLDLLKHVPAFQWMASIGWRILNRASSVIDDVLLFQFDIFRTPSPSIPERIEEES